MPWPLIRAAPHGTARRRGTRRRQRDDEPEESAADIRLLRGRRGRRRRTRGKRQRSRARRGRTSVRLQPGEDNLEVRAKYRPERKASASPPARLRCVSTETTYGRASTATAPTVRGRRQRSLKVDGGPKGFLKRIPGVDEPVAGAGLGQQVAGARRVGLDLCAQVRDVDVQVVRLHAGTPGPRPRAGASGESGACRGSVRARARGRTRAASA